MALLLQPTLARTLSSVRNLLNQPVASNSFWSDLELIEYINEGIRVYFSEVARLNEGYFLTSTTLDVVSGTESVALPTDCFQVRALYKRNANGYAILPYQNNLTDGYLTDAYAGPDTYFPSYHFQGNNLILRPIPNFSETASLKLDYIQFPDTLINGGNQLTAQISPIFKQVIEMYAVYKAKMKESLVNGVDLTTVAKANLNELYQQLQNSLRRRSSYPTYTIPFNPEG